MVVGGGERVTGWRSEVTPAVHHGRPQGRGRFQLQPHLLGEGDERGQVFGDALVRPGRVVVVCDGPVCWMISLKHEPRF